METNERLEAIIADFEFIDDWEDRYRYLIEMGQNLSPYPEASRDEAHKVRGCASQVWLDVTTVGDDPRLKVRADSDAHIVRGLVALALAAYDGCRAADVQDIDMPVILKRIGLDEHLTPQRANGFRSLVERIRAEAKAIAA